MVGTFRDILHYIYISDQYSFHNICYVNLLIDIFVYNPVVNIF